MIPAKSMTSNEISWWDISVVQVSLRHQWYLTKVVWWDISVVRVSLLSQCYLTRSFGGIFLWYKYPCYVNDITQNRLVRYICGTSFPAMSIIYHEISWWDIFVVEMIQVIQVIPLIQDNQVRLAQLWVDFRVIFIGMDIPLNMI